MCIDNFSLHSYLLYLFTIPKLNIIDLWFQSLPLFEIVYADY